MCLLPYFTVNGPFHVWRSADRQSLLSILCPLCTLGPFKQPLHLKLSHRSLYIGGLTMYIGWHSVQSVVCNRANGRKTTLLWLSCTLLAWNSIAAKPMHYVECMYVKPMVLQNLLLHSFLLKQYTLHTYVKDPLKPATKPFSYPDNDNYRPDSWPRP